MTVSTQETEIEYVASGVQSLFSFNFATESPLWIHVYIDGVEDLSATISINADQDNNPGGTANLLSIPTAGQIVLIRRETPLTQETDYPAYTRFPARDHENALDKLTMICQELDDNKASIDTEIISGDLETLDITDPLLGDDITITTITNVANGLLKLNASAQVDAIYLPPPGTTGDELIITSEVATPFLANLIFRNGSTLDDLAQFGFNNASALTIRGYNSLTSAEVEILSMSANFIAPGVSGVELEILRVNSSQPVTLGGPVCALTVGGEVSLSEPHLALSAGIIQAKATPTTAEELQLNPLGGAVTLGPAGQRYSIPASGAHAWTVDADEAAELIAGEFKLISASASPTFARLEFERGDNSNQLGFIGYDSSNTLLLWNDVDGQPVAIIATDQLGTPQGCAEFEPDLYSLSGNAGMAVPILNVLSSDVISLSSINAPVIIGTSLPGSSPHLAIASNAIQAKAQFDTATTLALNALGGQVLLSDGARTVDAVAGGLEINNTLTGSGFERALTETDLLSMPLFLDSDVLANYTLTAPDIGRTLIVTGSASGSGGSTFPILLPDNLFVGFWCNIISHCTAEVALNSGGTTLIRTPNAGTNDLESDMAVTVYQYDDSSSTAWWQISGQTIPA